MRNSFEVFLLTYNFFLFTNLLKITIIYTLWNKRERLLIVYFFYFCTDCFFILFFFQSFRGKWQPSAQPPIGFFCINNNNWPFTRSGTGSDNNSMNNDSHTHTRTHTDVLSLTRTGNEITQCAQCVLSLPRQVRLILWPPLSGLSNRARAIIIELALCCSCYVISCRGCNNNNNNTTPATTTTRAQLQQTKKN